MNVPSLTSSNLTDDLTDAMSAVAAPVVAAAGVVTAEAADLASSVAGTVTKGGGAVNHAATATVPAVWGLARRHPVLTIAALLTALGALLWRRRHPSSDDMARSTTNRPSPVTAAA